MGTRLPLTTVAGSPLVLDDDAVYRRWRDWKLAMRPARVEDMVVDVADARAPTPAERDALLRAIGRGGVALYRSGAGGDDRSLPRRLGAQLGVHRLDANWLADEDGISPIALVLHCVRPARAGGANALLDPELAYLALRDASPAHIRALLQPDAMTIPARDDATGVARAAQAGPVFSIDADGRLHLRYTARTRSIVWRDDAPTRAAVAALEALLATSPWVHRVRLEAGMGLVGHNVLHERSGFVDDPAAPRLLYRARFVDRIATPLDDAWR